MTDPPPQVWTVGHGARPLADLLAVLASARITLVVDVRRFPGSRRHPQYGRTALTEGLGAAGVGYEWWGEALGGRRSRSPDSRHVALRQAAFAGYADHMDTDVFRGAATDLLARAGEQRLAVDRSQSHRLHQAVRQDRDGWPVYDGSEGLPGL